MALDGEAHRLEQLRRARGVRRAVAGRIVGGNTHELGEEAFLVGAVRRKETADRRVRIGQRQLRIGGAKLRMNRASTRVPVAMSASVTASAGLWLMPPVQRTNSMPIGAMSMIAMPS